MDYEQRYKQEIAAFGKRLKEIRILKELTQVDLEIKSGINSTEISRIENGLKNIEFFTIVKIAETLKVELSDLFDTDRKVL